MDNQAVGRVQKTSFILTALALLAGVAIAWIDTRPRWDDAGVTAGALLIAAAFGGLVGIRPWLAAVLVVAPLLIAELGTAGAGLLIAPVVAFVGGYCGALGRSIATGSTK